MPVVDKRTIALFLAVWSGFLAGTTGCGGDLPVPGAGTTTWDSAGIRIIESASPAAADGLFAVIGAEPLLSIGLEEGDQNYLLHRVDDAHRFPDGRTAIANAGTHQIRYYDPSGRYVSAVGRRGTGPGEFAEVGSIRLYQLHDTLFATDGLRLHVYAPDGGFVDTRTLDLTGEVTSPYVWGVFDDGSFFVMALYGSGSVSGPAGTVIEPMQFSLLRYDSRGRRTNYVARAADRPRYVHEYGRSRTYPYIPFTASALFGHSGDEVYLVRSARPELELYTRTGQLKRIARWQRPMVRVAEIWHTERPRMLAAMSAQQRPRYQDFYSRTLPLPEFVPTYSALQVDSEQRVWLQRLRLGVDSHPPTWDVIGADGAWLGMVDAPHNFTPFQVGDTFVLGKHTDSLGVERVQLRALWRR